MKSILEELFYGNVCPNTDCRNNDKETKELMGYIADHHETLLKELDDNIRCSFCQFDHRKSKSLFLVYLSTQLL